MEGIFSIDMLFSGSIFFDIYFDNYKMFISWKYLYDKFIKHWLKYWSNTNHLRWYSKRFYLDKSFSERQCSFFNSASFPINWTFICFVLIRKTSPIFAQISSNFNFCVSSTFCPIEVSSWYHSIYPDDKFDRIYFLSWRRGVSQHHGKYFTRSCFFYWPIIWKFELKQCNKCILGII